MQKVTAKDLDNPTLKGAAYRSTHKLAVIGVLGDRAPKVSSRGSRFYNVDRWTVRVFVREMCKWAHENKECVPTRTEIKAWVAEANNETVPFREIVIANTPAKLKLRTALALTGGAYHEAFHTYYSCLRSLNVDEMARMVLPRWAKVPDWSLYYKLLQSWNNIVEDVRIERHGREEFPGSFTKLCDLQDFILAQEAKGIDNARAHGKVKAGRGALSVITATFRDIGLGYSTDSQREALAKYRAEAPEAVAFVLGAGKGNPGPLTEILKDAIALSAKDDIGCVRVALDVIGVLYDNSSEQDPANDEDNDEHQPGEAEKLVCPDCGAPGNKLVIRPKSDGRGGKVKGMGVLTCSVCGFQEEIQLQGSGGGKSKDKPPKADPKHTPKFEGFTKEDLPESKPGSGGESSDDEAESDDDDDDADGGGKGSADSDDDADAKGGSGGDGDEDDGDEDDGDEDDGDDDKGSGKADDDKDGDDGFAGNDWSDDDLEGDGDNAGGDDDGDDGTGSLDEGGTVGQVAQNESNTDADGDQPTPNAPGGGHNYEAPVIEGNDWSDLVDDALGEDADDTGLKDGNTALEDAVNAEADDEERLDGGVKGGERAWRPYDPAQDEFIPVQPSHAGKDHDREQADRLYASVKDEASYLCSRLRQIVKALEMTTTVHGIRKGRRLSTRFLVDSRNTLKGGQMPKRAYRETDAQVDTSTAAAIVLDQSGSMCGNLKDATRVLCAITEPLDKLGCPVQVSGFRDGHRHSSGNQRGDGGDYHRYNSIVHDVFKTFDEPLRSVKWRFANTRATGGTPMGDGVQFGLDALSGRPEGHRILFVITDGQPNGGHAAIIKRQVRLAKQAGIHVIGVGLGYGAEYVKDVFPDSVYTEKISDMPKALIAKLNELVDVKASKRGTRMKSTG